MFRVGSGGGASTNFKREKQPRISSFTFRPEPILYFPNGLASIDFRSKAVFGAAYQEGAPVVAATVCVASQAGAAPAFSAARMDVPTGCGSVGSFSGRAA